MANTQLMVSIAIVVALLAAISCASAQAPAPSPLQHKTKAPAPVPAQFVSPPIPTVEPPEMVPTVGSPAEMAPTVGSPPEMGPTPSNDCFTLVLTLSSCLTYVEAGSNLTSPEKGCCPSLASLVATNPVCLCQLFSNANSYGLQLDMNRALKLPSVCKVSTPPLSTCALLGNPVAAPTGAPTGSQTIPGMPPSMAPSSLIAAPPESNNGGSSFRISAALVSVVSIVGLSGAAALIF